MCRAIEYDRRGAFSGGGFAGLPVTGSRHIWEELHGQYRMLKMSGTVDLAVGTWGTK